MNIDKIRNILNMLFMLLALAAVVAYFAVKDNQLLFLYICGAAIVFKIVELFIRFTNR